MEVSIVAIGNSKGLRLSKTILDQYQIQDKVELVLEQGYIVIKPISKVRDGWEEAFKKMHDRGDDELLINDIFEEEELEEWS